MAGSPLLVPVFLDRRARVRHFQQHLKAAQGQRCSSASVRGVLTAPGAAHTEHSLAASWNLEERKAHLVRLTSLKWGGDLLGEIVEVVFPQNSE